MEEVIESMHDDGTDILIFVQDCVSTAEDADKLLDEYSHVQFPQELIQEKWLQIADQRIDFAADGTSYHMRLDQTEDTGRRWKSTYKTGAEDGQGVICLRLSLEADYNLECGILLAQDFMPGMAGVRILVPGCHGDAAAFRNIGGTLTPRGRMFGAEFPGGPDLVRTGQFVDD